MITPGRYKLFIFSSWSMILSAILLLAAFFLWDMNRWTRLDKLSTDLESANEEIALLKSKLGQQKDYDTVIFKLREEIMDKIPNLDDNNEKIRLLGTLHNENLAAIANKNFGDIIFIGRDWNISRLPKYLDMDRSDIAWISKFLTKQIGPAIPKIPK